MYRQIADALQRDIDSGDLAPGAQIPTEAELREQFGRDGLVSRNTVRDAIKLLVAKGLVETRPGQGTFVVEKPDPIVTSVRPGREVIVTTHPPTGGRESPDRLWTATDPRVEIQQASEEVAQQLGLATGTMVISRHQERRLLNGDPWSLQTTFYPMEYYERGATKLIRAEDIPETVVVYLQKELGIKEVRRRDTITARAPDRNEAVFFGLPDDGRVPMQEVRRTGFDEEGCPVRVTVTVYAADRNVLAYELGEQSGRQDDPG
jgi:GntR family transcriptional regulator